MPIGAVVVLNAALLIFISEKFRKGTDRRGIQAVDLNGSESREIEGTPVSNQCPGVN
jgi:hypothetical protein